MILLLIGLGGAVGSIMRYLLGRLVQGSMHSGFPFGTLTVNLLGCILIGALTKLLMHAQTEQLLRAALVVGFCGGFTTFSTFSLETVGLMAGGEWLLAASYVAASVATCVAGTAIGMRFGPTLNR